jgi:hypothetical protein
MNAKNKSPYKTLSTNVGGEIKSQMNSTKKKAKDTLPVIQNPYIGN